MVKLKLSFADAINVRNARQFQSRYRVAKSYHISEALVTKTCRYSDRQLLQAYSDTDNSVFDSIELDGAHDNRVDFIYNGGPFDGYSATVSAYALLHSKFSPSFATLDNPSKLTIIWSKLVEHGYEHVYVDLIGDDVGIDNRYVALADGKRLDWEDITEIAEMQTILNLKDVNDD